MPIDWNPFSDKSWDEPEALGGARPRKFRTLPMREEEELKGFSKKPVHKELPQPDTGKRAGSEKVASATADLSLPPGMKRILIIDDNLMVRRNHKLFLERLGFKAMEAVNGQNGLDKMAHYGPESFSLVIVDLNMPVMSGEEFVQKAESQFDKKLPPIWVCTVSADAEIVKSLLMKGVAGYLLKPVQLRVFATKLQELFPDMEIRIP